jgi:hypothetical protein
VRNGGNKKRDPGREDARVMGSTLPASRRIEEGMRVACGQLSLIPFALSSLPWDPFSQSWIPGRAGSVISPLKTPVCLREDESNLWAVKLGGISWCLVGHQRPVGG